VPGLILAAISPDNTPHGYNWTFAFPMLLFIVVALILYLLFSRPHRRVPVRPIAAAAGHRPSATATSAMAASATATSAADADAVAGDAQAGDATASDNTEASE
jgi:hypothetical protein